jgi:hypothetical protein
VRFDHAILAVRDFERAAAELWEEHGLAAVPGGRHAGWGTGNWIVPLGPSYLELIGVVDLAEASGNDVGRRLLRQLEEGDHLIGWCAAPEDFEGTTSRLRLAVSTGARERPDGLVLRWRSAGFELAIDDPSRPFFISWDVPEELHPGRMEAPHAAQPHGIIRVGVSGDPAAVASWLGEERTSLLVEVRPGPPRLMAVTISTDRGEVVLS